MNISVSLRPWVMWQQICITNWDWCWYNKTWPQILPPALQYMARRLHHLRSSANLRKQMQKNVHCSDLDLQFCTMLSKFICELWWSHDFWPKDKNKSNQIFPLHHCCIVQCWALCSLCTEYWIKTPLKVERDSLTREKRCTCHSVLDTAPS